MRVGSEGVGRGVGGLRWVFVMELIHSNEESQKKTNGNTRVITVFESLFPMIGNNDCCGWSIKQCD